MVELGDEAEDKVSGFKGIAVAEHNFLNGCTRFSIQPKINKDGTLPEAQSFDEPQLKIIKAGKVKQGSTETGGPEKYMPTKRPGE